MEDTIKELKLKCQIYREKANSFQELINELVQRDWSDSENIRPLFSDDLNDCWYYSIKTFIIYKQNKEMIGFLTNEGTIKYIVP
jgi:hypothetical protein